MVRCLAPLYCLGPKEGEVMGKDTLTPKDVDDLLVDDSGQEDEIAALDAEVPTATDEAVPRRRRLLTPSVVVIVVVVILSLIGLGIIYSNPVLTEQFEALLAGELGEYKEQLRKAQEDRIRRIERLSANLYGSMVLMYSPKDARVTIKQLKYELDCSKSKSDDSKLLECLEQPMNYSQTPEVKEIDNPSLHIDRSKKEIVEQIPLNDMPIQESSEDRSKVHKYEYTVRIEREGYYPRTFFLTADKERRPPKDVEVLYWIQRGPGFWTVDFQGADLMPRPETVRDNYVAARKDIKCMLKQVEAKRKAGRHISDDTVEGLYLELINRHGFKTFEEWHSIEQELQKDTKWWSDLEKELKKHSCPR